MILFILSFYYIFKCSMVQRWPLFYPILLIMLSLVPRYEGVVTVGILVYGMLNCGSLCDAPSDIFRARRT